MTAEDTLRAVHAHYALARLGEWERIPEVVGRTFTRHGPEGSRTLTREEYMAETREAIRARGVLRWEYDVFADDDTAFVTWVARGAAGGVMSNVQAFRAADGRLIETWRSAAAPAEWTLRGPAGSGSPEANKDLLRRWYEEMYEQRRFAELAPRLCGPVFTRHEASGTFDATADEHGARLAAAVGARDEKEGRTRLVREYRAFAAGDRVGTIATSGRQGSYVQVWRVADGRFVESWWAGMAGVDW